MPEPERPATVRDLAKAAGVSQATVYLALQNHPRISEKRRLQIQKLAREMGYHPNAMASMLAHQRFNGCKPIKAALAWINLWNPPEDLRRRYREFEHYWRGAKEAAEEFGYHLEEIPANSVSSMKSIEKILLARGISGILLSPTNSFTDWGAFRWELFSVVRFGRSMTSPRFHVVTADQVANTILSFESMRARGYSRLGFVDGTKLLTGRLFSAGFLQAQSELNPRSRVKLFSLDTLNPQASLASFSTWLRKEKPDAILAESPSIADLLNKCGLRVPTDIGLATTTILDGGTDSGIDQNPKEIGRAAVHLLISLIRHSDRGIPNHQRELLIAGKWQEGSTLPARI